MSAARFLECKVVATGNINLSGQPQTIDGVPVMTGDSVLATGTPAGERGVWKVTPAGHWTREPNALTEQDFLGMTIVVREGAHADTMWQCRNDPPITVGVTDLAFGQLPNLVDKYQLDRLTKQQLASEVAITKDADATISIADGQRYKLLDDGLTLTRFRTLLDIGAFAGDKVYFRSEQKGSTTVAAYNSLVVKNASGAPILNVLRQGLYIAEFDGTQWCGATPTGMQVFNVKDYGAIGDETITVNDTPTERAAVQRCIDAAATHARNPHSSGAVVYFPPGIYRTDGDALILRRTPYNSPMVYLGAGGNSATLMNATGCGPAGDVARVETLAEGFFIAEANNPGHGADSYLWGGERHLFQDLCFNGKHYGINWDLGDAGVPYGDAVRGSPHFHRCFFSRTYSPGPCVRWRRASRARFNECVVNVSNFLAGTGGFEIVEGSSSFLSCRGGGQLIHIRDSSETSIIACRAEGGRGIPAWDFVNVKSLVMINTANEGHEERDALYRFQDCRAVTIDNAVLASTDRPYHKMEGCLPMSYTPRLTIIHTPAIGDSYAAANKIVRSTGSWFEDLIGNSSRIRITSAVTNTGWLNVIEATHDTLWVQETVTDEIVDPATAIGTIYDLTNAFQPRLTFDKATNTITRTDPPDILGPPARTLLAGSFHAEGFEVGMVITTTSSLNPGPYTITGISSDGTQLGVWEALGEDEVGVPGLQLYGSRFVGGLVFRNCWGIHTRNVWQNLRFADLGDQTRYGIEVDANCRDGRVENIHRGASPDILIDPAAYNVTGESHGHSDSPSIRRTWWLGRHRMIGLDIEENIYHARVGQPLAVTGLSGLSVKEDANGFVGIWFDPTAGSSGWKASRSVNETTLTTLQDFYAARFVGPPLDHAQIVANFDDPDNPHPEHGVVIAKTTSALGDTPLVTFTKPGSESTQSFAGDARVWAPGYISIESTAQVQLVGATTADLYGGGLLGVRVSASGVTLGGNFTEHDGQISSAVQVDADGATVTFNFNQGNVHQVTLGGNRTVAFSNLRSGATYVLFLIQDGSGNRTVTWPGTAQFGAAGTPILSTAANKRDAIIGTSDGTNVYFHTVSKGF